MDVSNSLQATLLRRTAEAAERAAETRSERRREKAAEVPVDYAKAVNEKEKHAASESVDPAAVYEKLFAQDTEHLIDIVT